ncbi:MAG: NAD(P)-dependent oxidoreductase [Candidatus Heimdallarchaeota archaeon]|nr:NAD(P)-dependent oxidoreductase [Candidatus Heimdallarchaeota archaeon]
MRVLLTGAFGNVGQRTLEVLLKKEYKVRCFDLKTPRNVNTELQLRKLGNYEVVWGDIRDPNISQRLVEDVDYIIHLAAIIPPLAYDMPELAYDVNVTGSTNLLRAAEKCLISPKFIYISSIAVHGNRMKYEPPTIVDDPLNPLSYDNYAQHKVKMEMEFWNSKLPWVILRFAAVTPFEMTWNVPDIMYDIPLEQRIEIVDSRDAALACVNALSADIVGKTLFIGGGKGNQLYQREYVSKMLDALGIAMLPESAFKQVRTDDDYYHCDWMYTKDAQELLNFQHNTFDDFLKVFRMKIRFRRFLISLVKPIARKILLNKSPYYTKPKRTKRKGRTQRKPIKTQN